MITFAASLFMLLIHVTTLLLLVLLSIRLLRNLDFLRWVRQSAPVQAEQPRVSVLVPARNEGRHIQQCIEALAQQAYPNYEILVLDDQSTDGTFQQLQQLAEVYPVLQLIRGDSAPPPGWNGKSYACQRLAQHASGEWLLFTDADTLHTPESIVQGIKQARWLDVDLLSAMPQQITNSWSERLLVSFIMDFLPLLGIDLRGLWQQRSSHAIANGQYMLVRAAVYHEVGGHAAVQSALVDDFALANHFVQNERRYALVNGTYLVACRMYRNAGEIWQGYSKNIVLSLQTAARWPWWSALLFAWGFVALFIWPYALLALQLSKGLALVEIGWLSVLRLSVGYEYRRPLAEAFFTPLSALGVMLLGLNALLLKYRQQPIRWKDRSYWLTP